MDPDKLDLLRRELESFVGSYRHETSAELEYHLTRLTNALTAFVHVGFRSLYPRQHRAELLGQLDSLLAQTDDIRTIALLAREVLLRPPTDEKTPGFTE
jgi:hypothetical protein